MLNCLLRHDEPRLKGSFAAPAHAKRGGQIGEPLQNGPSVIELSGPGPKKRGKPVKRSARKDSASQGHSGDRFAPIGDRRRPSGEHPGGPDGAARRTPRTGQPIGRAKQTARAIVRTMARRDL